MNCISSISYGFELVSPTRSVKAMRWLCCEPKQEELISNRSLCPSKAVTWKRRNAPGVNSSGEFGRLADYCIHNCLINTSFSCMFGKLAITKKEKSVVVLELKQLSLTALSTLYLMCSVLFLRQQALICQDLLFVTQTTGHFGWKFPSWSVMSRWSALWFCENSRGNGPVHLPGSELCVLLSSFALLKEALLRRHKTKRTGLNQVYLILWVSLSAWPQENLSKMLREATSVLKPDVFLWAQRATLAQTPGCGNYYPLTTHVQLHACTL